MKPPKDWGDQPIDLSKVSNLVFGGVDHSDAPDYVDVYILSCDYGDAPANDFILDELNQDSQYIYEQFIKQIH